MNVKQIRAWLRKEIPKGTLEGRCVYRDFYDSCHPPTETPDAPWTPVVLYDGNGRYNDGKVTFSKRDLRVGGYYPTIKEGLVELTSGGYVTYQVRVKK